MKKKLKNIFWQFIFLLKFTKYYIFNHIIILHVKLFIINLINLKILRYLFIEKRISSLGNFSSKLNPIRFSELQLIDNSINDIHYIQGLRYFLQQDTVFYLYKVNSNILHLFTSLTLNCQTFVCTNNAREGQTYNKNFKILNEVRFFLDIKNSNYRNKILITEDSINEDLSCINNLNYIFSKKKIRNHFIKYYNKYIYDFYGKINLNPGNCIFNYFLYSKNKLLKNSNKNGISGIALLKSLDLYPFDICYESALKFIDELIIGVDSSSFNSRYEKILNNFLKNTKYKKKIKLNFFNFFSETTNNCFARGRWIADVNNKLANQTSNKFVTLIGADELFETDKLVDIKKLLYKDIDEVVANFYHFVYNLNYIRDPRFSAYNKFMRIFNKNYYVSTDDGMGFRKINNLRVNAHNINFKIFHLGYIYNYKKKVSTHLSKTDGLFGNQLTQSDFYKNMRPIRVNSEVKRDLLKTLDHFKYLNGYKDLINYSK